MRCLSSPDVTLQWAHGVTHLRGHTSAVIADAVFEPCLCSRTISIWFDPPVLSNVGGYRECAALALPTWPCSKHLV
jgi:hypothetical protein